MTHYQTFKMMEWNLVTDTSKIYALNSIFIISIHNMAFRYSIIIHTAYQKHDPQNGIGHSFEGQDIFVVNGCRIPIKMRYSAEIEQVVFCHLCQQLV